MGLDMYLNAKRYFWTKEEAPKIEGVPEGYAVGAIDIDVAYWRKANAIHQWFVENVQEGEDDCQAYGVTRDDMKALVDTCKLVIAEPEKAPELLPTQEGFFFGDTDYDEYYFECLHDTVKQLESILAGFNSDHWFFEYKSSW
jgi:hypothetical protein